MYHSQCIEEVVCILQKMKMKNASGPDDLTTEYLRYGGPTIAIWLTEVLNSIVELERIPVAFKQGITIPIYIQRRREGYFGCPQLSTYRAQLSSFESPRISDLGQAGTPFQ